MVKNINVDNEHFLLVAVKLARDIFQSCMGVNSERILDNIPAGTSCKISEVAKETVIKSSPRFSGENSYGL